MLFYLWLPGHNLNKPKFGGGLKKAERKVMISQNSKAQHDLPTGFFPHNYVSVDNGSILLETVLITILKRISKSTEKKKHPKHGRIIENSMDLETEVSGSNLEYLSHISAKNCCHQKWILMTRFNITPLWKSP